MKNSEIVKLRQETAMLEAKIDALFSTALVISGQTDDAQEKIIEIFSERISATFLRLLKQRGLPFPPLVSSSPDADAF